MGIALDESTEGMEKLESNGVEAYINPKLYETVSQRGNIFIEFGTDRFGESGYSIAIKRNRGDQEPSCS